MADNWYAGNANDDASQHRGWLLGHFINPAVGAAGQPARLKSNGASTLLGRNDLNGQSESRRSTLVLLISGKFRIDLTVGNVTLERQGDYITWGPGIDHSWQAEQDSIVITVRWPSTP